MIGEWVRGLRRFDGPIIWAQPTLGPIIGWRCRPDPPRPQIAGALAAANPQARPPPGFPRHYLGGVHNPDVLAIEHANMLLAVCT